MLMDCFDRCILPAISFRKTYLLSLLFCLLFSIFYLPNSESYLCFLFMNFHRFQLMMSRLLTIFIVVQYLLYFLFPGFMFCCNKGGSMYFHNHLFFVLNVNSIYSNPSFLFISCSPSFVQIIYNYHIENLLGPLHFLNLAFFSIQPLDSHINQICFFAIFLFAFATRFNQHNRYFRFFYFTLEKLQLFQMVFFVC